MALTTTTVSTAIGVNDVNIVVASATGFAAGNFVLIDQEVFKVAQGYVSGTTIPVLRGQEGSVTTTHKATANAVSFLGSDEPGPSATTFTQWPYVRARRVLSYSAAGAITLPATGEDMVAVINGTAALAMTLVAPTKDQDGNILTIVANGKAAHTVTLTAGFSTNTTNSDVMTFHATQTTGFQCIACNGVWVLLGFVAGAATVAGSGLA